MKKKRKVRVPKEHARFGALKGAAKSYATLVETLGKGRADEVLGFFDEVLKPSDLEAEADRCIASARDAGDAPLSIAALEELKVMLMRDAPPPGDAPDYERLGWAIQCAARMHLLRLAQWGAAAQRGRHGSGERKASDDMKALRSRFAHARRRNPALTEPAFTNSNREKQHVVRGMFGEPMTPQAQADWLKSEFGGDAP